MDSAQWQNTHEAEKFNARSMRRLIARRIDRNSLFGRLPTERCAFGQHAAGHQLLGVIGAIMCVTMLANFDATIIRVFALLGLAVSLFWYVIPGHAMIYGPHLFLLAIADLFRRSNNTDND